MKKLINSPDTVVTDALAGMAAAYPGRLSVDIANKVMSRAGGPEPGKVGLVSGGGSGNEPLHAGYVGKGMLGAACAGEVFTSPVPDQVLTATKAVNGGAGVLHIVKNYTGDVLNFQIVAELADDEDIEVASVVVNDDVAVQDSGEPSRTRAPLAPAREIVATAMDAIHAVSGDLLVMLGGMGGTPLIELFGAFAEVSRYIEGHGGRIARNLVGNYITSLEMQGFSVTVCQLTPDLTQLWDAPVDTPGLRWGR